MPTGTFTFIGPEKKSYTLPEVIDIINDGLLSAEPTQKYYLIHGQRTFTVVGSEAKPRTLTEWTRRAASASTS